MLKNSEVEELVNKLDECIKKAYESDYPFTDVHKVIRIINDRHYCQYLSDKTNKDLLNKLERKSDLHVFLVDLERA